MIESSGPVGPVGLSQTRSDWPDLLSKGGKSAPDLQRGGTGAEVKDMCKPIG